jgi:hypothetical protein
MENHSGRIVDKQRTNQSNGGTILSPGHPKLKTARQNENKKGHGALPAKIHDSPIGLIGSGTCV